ncbi:hypothetical protein CLV53_104215 [Sediminibacterium magnilacihabitans]|jgi:hypothetical protein|nr:hypothetical protein CLV53_104215 [Sediminibacterium magnilacihabitans]
MKEDFNSLNDKEILKVFYPDASRNARDLQLGPVLAHIP